MDNYIDVKHAVITAVYRHDRPSLSTIVAFVSEHRAVFQLPSKDTTEKNIAYTLLILQRDQIVQRFVGRDGDFYVINPLYNAEPISRRYTIVSVHIDDAISSLEATHDDSTELIAQSVIFERTSVADAPLVTDATLPLEATPCGASTTHNDTPPPSGCVLF